MVLGPDQAIVRLRYIPGLFNTYLRFVSGGVGSWRFAGAFAPDVKYFEPRHGLIRFGDKPFLLVTGQGYSGSGLSTELQSWLDLSRSGMEPVFQILRKPSFLSPVLQCTGIFPGAERQHE